MQMEGGFGAELGASRGRPRPLNASTRRRVDALTRRLVDASTRRRVDASTRRRVDALARRRVVVSRNDVSVSVKVRCKWQGEHQ